MKEEKYIAKLIIKNLSEMSVTDLDRTIGWLEARLAEVREEYERDSKTIANSNDPKYDKTYTSRLIK